MVSSTRRNLLLRSASPAMIQSRCLGTDRSEEERFERKGRFEGNSTSLSTLLTEIISDLAIDCGNPIALFAS